MEIEVDDAGAGECGDPNHGSDFEREVVESGERYLLGVYLWVGHFCLVVDEF